MPKQLNVDLAFSADTSQVRRQLQELQQQLAQLTSGDMLNSKNSFHLTEDLKTAVDAASKLRVTLQEATDANTGKLDLTKFQESMNASQMSIGKYKDALLSLGPEGQKAFANLASSITQAEIPMRRTNALMKEFGVTLMNAARWQFSSSVLHGLMSAVQGAYGYAQDLNESLTNIAIVTGRSTDQMAQFAEQANKSAQALSTTTTAYTDAALIYYQQGLGDAEVKERTDATIQLANVTGQSAEQVSSYMTAIWNNFEDGAHSVEYYADVITALGAATASSSEEIAKGMQQFAAVADTVGLSYEYAATALATIVAQTRQSESTVGNGLRTIFARFDSVKLGDTLEDGVGLTKYTEALEKVGVSVLNQNGELKEMDEILNAIGEKWETLNKTQQTALAQTVGGVRQYTNLMALFDNWDTFQKNLSIAQGAEGSLQEQADIYAQSWEAAQKRVKAAWQSIYQDLIDDKFFISVLNGLEQILHGIDNFIDDIGGLKGVLLTLGTVASTVLRDQIAKGIDNAIFGFKMMTQAGQESYFKMKKEANQELIDTYSGTDSSKDVIGNAYAQQGVLNNAYLDNVEKMSEAERALAQMKLDQQKTMIENVKIQALENAELEKKIGLQETSFMKDVARYNADKKNENNQIDLQEVSSAFTTIRQNAQAQGSMDVALSSLNNIKIDPSNVASFKEANEEITKIIDSLGKNGNGALDSFSDKVGSVANNLQNMAKDGTLTQESFTQLKNTLIELTMAEDESEGAWETLREKYLQVHGDTEKTRDEFAALREEFEQNGRNGEILAQKMGLLGDFTKKAGEDFYNTQLKAQTMSQSFVTIAGSFTAIGAAINQLKGFAEVIGDDSLSAGEKFVRVLTTIGMLIPTITRVFNAQTVAAWKNIAAKLANIVASKGLADAEKIATFAKEGETIATQLGTKATEEQVIANMSLSTSFSVLMPWIVGITAAIVGLVAIFAIFDAAIYSSSERMTDANKNLAESKEALEQASQAADSAKQAYDDLASTLDGWSDKRKGIDELTEGTLEFRQAVTDANQEMIQLLENAGMMGKVDIQYDKNGVAYLKPSDVAAVLQAQMSKAMQAAATETVAKVTVEANKKDVAVAKALQDIRNAETPGYYRQSTDVSQRYDAAEYVNGKGAWSNKTDEEVVNSINSLVKQYLASDFGSEELTKELIDKNSEQLSFLAEIADDEDIIKAINDAADAFRTSNKASDDYKTQFGQELAEASGGKYNWVPEDMRQSFYKDIANEVLGGQNFEAAAAQRWETGGPTQELNDRYAFAEERGYQWIEAEKQFVDAQGNVVKDLSDAYIEQWAYAKEKMAEAQDADFSGAVEELRHKMIQGIRDATPEGELNKEQLDSLNSMNDQQLGYMYKATLEFDEAASYEQLAAKANELKEEAYNHKLFEYEMQIAQNSGLDMDAWTEYIEYLKSVNEEFANNEALAASVATQNMRLNKGVKSLVDDFDDYRKILEQINESGDESLKYNEDWAESMTGVQQALADIANTDLKSIQALGDDFILENMDLIQEAAYGDKDAIDELIRTINAAEYTQMKVGIEDEDALMAIDNLMAAIDDINFNDIVIGTSLDDAKTQAVLQAFQQMVDEGLLTADTINGALAQIGYSPIVTYAEGELSATDTASSSAGGSITYTDPETGESHVFQLSDNQAQNYITEQGHFKIPIVKGTNGGGIQIAEGNHLAGALSQSVFTGGVGRNLSPSNRNAGAANRPKSGSSCFAAGTLITVDNHYKNIEDVKVGDIVLSYNEKTKKNEFSEVVQTMIHFVHEKIYNLFIKNDKLVVTGNHKFLITHNGIQEWKQASDIEIGDLVLLANGLLCEISNINIETKFLTVYNFEVSNTHNYYVGENQILAHNKGGKGGKGSGSGKAREKKKEKDLEEKKKEEDRYHDLEEAIEDVDTALDRLDKSKDRAFGKNKINLMNLEIKKFKEQIDLTKKYIEEIKKYQKVDKAALEQKLKDIGMSQAEIAKQFDANGVLTSYEDLFAKIQDHFNNTALADLNKAREEYNAKVREWNAGGLDEDSWKEVEENLKEAEEIYKEQEGIYKEQLDALKQYEETTNLLQEKQQELIDQMNDLFDKALDIAREKIELEITVNDRDTKRLEWIYSHLGDDADKAADKIANLNKQAEVAIRNIKTNADGLRNIFSGLQEAYNGKDGKKLIDFSGIDLNLDIDNPEAMIKTVNQVIDKLKEVGAEADIKTFLDDITKYEDGLMEYYDVLADKHKEIIELIQDTYEQEAELLEKNLDTNDHMQDLIQSYQDIADLLGQEHMGLSDKEMRQWRNSILELQRDSAQIAKANWDSWKQQRAEAVAAYNEAVANGTKVDIEQAKARLETVEKLEQEAHKEYLDRVQEMLRTAQEMYEQTLEDNERAYQRALGGGLSPTLDKLQEQLDMQKELNHLHLDDYEKYKKLGDLQANINKQLANNPNVKVQGKLKDLLDDVNKKMEAGAEISEGEATILEKRLLLLQAEDQLMAARNAKSAVRMTRDNEGNFSYTYTADTSKIEEAQQNYADKFYDLLDYERKYSEDTQAAILQSYKEFQDKRNDIINDETLTDSEKKALMRQLEKDLQAKVQFYTDEMQMVVDEMGRLKNEDWQDMQQTLGRLLAEDDDFETKFEDTTLAKIAPAWNNATDALKAFLGAAGALKLSDFQAMDDLADINNSSMQEVDSSTVGFGQELMGVYDQIEQKSDELTEAAKKMAEDTKQVYDDMLNKAKYFADEYGQYYEDVFNNIQMVTYAVDELRRSLAGVEKVNVPDILNEALGGDMSDEVFAEAVAASMAGPDSTQGITRGSPKGGGGGARNSKGATSTPYDAAYNAMVEAFNNGQLEWDLLNTYLRSLDAINYAPLLGLDQQEFLQNVRIEAAFPNVSSHAEIEQAINNLINSASQYVNRKS